MGAKNGDLALLIQGGLGLGLSIDVGIASGAASIVLAMQVDTSISPLNIMGILTGQASVDVLEGLASASLTLSAGLGIAPDLTLPPNPVQWPPPSSITLPSETITLTASVGVGIHISICWVVDVDFDGYWQFSQSITTPSVTVPF